MLKHPALIPSIHHSIERKYTDKEVFIAIRNPQSGNSHISNWFFQKARSYAMGTWQKKYARLQASEWDAIFSAVDFKLVTRIKGGLVLQKGTKLLSYYTTITGYAILDYLEDLKKEAKKALKEVHIQKAVLPSNTLEKEELATQLIRFLEKVIQNKPQIQVFLLFSKGYSYREIVERTNYQSEGACRNAFLKAKKKMLQYIKEYPDQGVQLKNLLKG